MGEKDKAIEYLQKSLEAGFRRFVHISRDRDLDNIRNTNEFKSLIKNMRLSLILNIQKRMTKFYILIKKQKYHSLKKMEYIKLNVQSTTYLYTSF